MTIALIELCAAPDFEPGVGASHVRYYFACGSKPVSFERWADATMRRITTIVVCVALLSFACSHRAASDPVVNDLRIRAFRNLVDESDAAVKCLAIGDPISRRPLDNVDRSVLQAFAYDSTVRGYGRGCEQGQAHVLTISWIDLQAESAVAGAAKWYGGQNSRGGLLCDIELRHSEGSWSVVRPFRDRVFAVIN